MAKFVTITSIFDRSEQYLPPHIREALEKEAAGKALTAHELAMVNDYHADKTKYHELKNQTQAVCVDKKDPHAEDPDTRPECKDIPKDELARAKYVEYGVHYFLSFIDRQDLETQAANLALKWANDGKRCDIPEMELKKETYVDLCGNKHYFAIPDSGFQ